VKAGACAFLLSEGARVVGAPERPEFVGRAGVVRANGGAKAATFNVLPVPAPTLPTNSGLSGAPTTRAPSLKRKAQAPAFTPAPVKKPKLPVPHYEQSPTPFTIQQPTPTVLAAASRGWTDAARDTVMGLSLSLMLVVGSSVIKSLLAPAGVMREDGIRVLGAVEQPTLPAPPSRPGQLYGQSLFL